MNSPISIVPIIFANLRSWSILAWLSAPLQQEIHLESHLRSDSQLVTFTTIEQPLLYIETRE